MRRLMAARRWDGTMAEATYVLGGPHETRITVVSQQVRAINLAVALARSGVLEGKLVGVVGAGAGGATFAAAAALLGAAEVHLYDEHEEPVSTQRWSFDRYLHPNLFDWPVEGWDGDEAGLPIATWSAGPSAAIRRELLTAFAYAAREGGVRWHPQRSVSEVRERAGGVWVTTCDLRTVAQQPPADLAKLSVKRFDQVVVATGFLPEAPVPNVDASGSYWKDQNLPGTIGADHVTIIGDGDGALTELLLLTVCRASGAQAHEQLRAIAETLSTDRAQVSAILDVESALSASRSRGSLEEYGQAFGSSWTPELDGVASIEVRTGRVALRRTSFAINRFLAARLVSAKGSSIRFVQGGHHAIADVEHMGPTRVIWRTGSRMRDRTLLVKPALAVRAAGDAIARDPEYQDVVGTVDQLMDYTRERLWGKVPELAHRTDGSAVEALFEIEDRSEPGGDFAAPWPGFVEHQPKGDLRAVVRRLAALADHLSDAGVLGSSFSCHRALDAAGGLDLVADLSVDLVAVTADLTPTEVVHRLRVNDQEDGIALVCVEVNRTGRKDGLVDRLMVRCRLRGDGDPLPARTLAPAQDYTSISLLLAPGFAVGDVEADGPGVTRFRPPVVPRVDDPALKMLVDAATRKRERTPHGDRGEAAVELLAAVAEGSEDAEATGNTEATVITEAWRLLDSPDDADVRRGLVRLAALIAARQPPSELTARHLAELSDDPLDAGLVRLLLQAAFGRLVRAGRELERDEDHLRWLMTELLPEQTERPPPASPDAIARLRLRRFGLKWDPDG